MLQSASNFAVLAGSTVTNTGPSWITGQVGVSPGTAITGFPPGASGPQHTGADPVAVTAKTDLTAAYGRADASLQPCPAGNNHTGANLGGLTLVPGVYCQTTAPTLTGTLTLNGAGVYLFQIGTNGAPTTLITAAGAPGAPAATIACIGGCDPCQVFWRVTSSATINAYTSFVGNIMALASISMLTGASLNGRALAQTGAVTLQSNRIIQPTCTGFPAPAFVAAPVTPTPTPAAAAAGAAAASTVGLPNTGGPPQQPGLPWLPLAIAIAIGALVFGLRRRTQKRGS
jgi:hypothetical protein